MRYRPSVGASSPTRTQYSEWAPVGFFVSRILRGVKWVGAVSDFRGRGAIDSRLRGNDVDGGGNDVDGGGNNGGECGIDVVDGGGIDEDGGGNNGGECGIDVVDGGGNDEDGSGNDGGRVWE